MRCPGIDLLRYKLVEKNVKVDQAKSGPARLVPTSMHTSELSPVIVVWLVTSVFIGT